MTGTPTLYPVVRAQLKLQQAAVATKPVTQPPSRPATNGDALGRYSRAQAV